MLVAVDGLSYAAAADCWACPPARSQAGWRGRAWRWSMALEGMESIGVGAAGATPGKEWVMDKVDPATLVAYRDGELDAASQDGRECLAADPELRAGWPL